MPNRISFSSYPKIIIQKDANLASCFHLTIIELLNKIISEPIGKMLVQSLSTNGKAMGYWGGEFC